ncbi:Inner membrane protein of type IV secretion of T-DNA complex, TonB-like, VirB10 [Candidatus Burkholderia verschuerenii]|uniref:Inner membrane protein of type IV secretion of T-DNA complex, TonB-like, VirB10 n=1 Tax=Candidatus Burkholderia verschuerenii TaxID=242163 RepID=A0A0L0MFA3_9BURK|nr:type IV secretion system protein VirB10 [Candidatus Burkholderia verschuerenii]KND60965.1 Inner membrane protein of type IV secretion of T-DNA complex, TonB-like, VirB10 [Candidatus Burkholderia verschuerenii]
MSIFDRFKRDQAEPDAAANQLGGEPAHVEGDRGIPSVNTKRRSSLLTRLFAGVLFLFALALLAVSGWTLYKKYLAPAESPAQATPKKRDELGNGSPLDLSKAKPSLPASQPAGFAQAASAPAAASQPAQATQPVRVQGQQKAPLTPAERKREKGMMYGSGESAQPVQPPPGGGAGGGALLGGNGNSQQNGLGSMLTSTRTPMAVATMLPDPDYLVQKGTVIDCIAQSAINTTQPGMLNCLGSDDVYSKSNRVILLDRGTVYHVEYQRGLNQGQDRIFMLASRADTPQNVSIDLDSPVTDALGRAGLTGTINTHFWQRFGGAIMVGLVGDLGQAVTNRAMSSGSQFSVNNTTQSTSSAADVALQNSVNIPPTLEHNQGAHIKLYIARDLDFRSVYGLAEQQ